MTRVAKEFVIRKRKVKMICEIVTDYVIVKVNNSVKREKNFFKPNISKV